MQSLFNNVTCLQDCCKTYLLHANLKELRNYILGIILAWSLFCLIQVYVGLHFLKFLFENQLQTSLSVRSVFCFESNVSNQDIKICVIMILKRSICHVILFSICRSPRSSHRSCSREKLVVLKISLYSQENNFVVVSFQQSCRPLGLQRC